MDALVDRATTILDDGARERVLQEVVKVAMDDQALIPVKTVDFDGGVNVTLGLPFIRTSVDHGVALDLAGKGTADVGSLQAALACALDLIERRNA